MSHGQCQWEGEESGEGTWLWVALYKRLLSFSFWESVEKLVPLATTGPL